MLASPQVSLVDAPRLGKETLMRLRGLLVADAQVQADQYAEHEAARRQLRDLMDADSVLERELAEAGAARAREAMTEIDHALERLDNGSYGTCESCGRPVPVERLEAIPAARFCVACPRRRTGWQ